MQFQDWIEDFLKLEQNYKVTETTEYQIEKFVEWYNLESKITRQEIMKIIAKMSGETIPVNCTWKFIDVDRSGWGCKYIEWALAKWYIANNSTFRPEDDITKTESIKLIMKVKGLEKTQQSEYWQKDYAVSAFKYGLVEESYSDYNSPALRGWVFAAALAAIIKTEEDEKIEKGLISDEVL